VGNRYRQWKMQSTPDHKAAVPYRKYHPVFW
jgi:hypothetical protein